MRYLLSTPHNAPRKKAKNKSGQGEAKRGRDSSGERDGRRSGYGAIGRELGVVVGWWLSGSWVVVGGGGTEGARVSPCVSDSA